jgi:hypothetical protein
VEELLETLAGVRLEPESGASMLHAIRCGLDLLRLAQRDDSLPDHTVVLVTDGSGEGFGDRYRELGGRCHQEKVKIHAVSINPATDWEFVKELASKTGGRSEVVPDQWSLERFFLRALGVEEARR